MDTQTFIYGCSFLALGILVLTIAGYWAIFRKAGLPGWAILVPIYNLYCLLKIAKLERYFSTIILFILSTISLFGLLVLAVILQKPSLSAEIFSGLLALIAVLGSLFTFTFNTIINVLMWYNIARFFSKGLYFTTGLMALPFIFVPILGFGSAQYNPEGGQGQDDYDNLLDSNLR